MQLLVIGDVHACYYTLKQLVQKHWEPQSCMLIQLGDLINKGPFSSKCIDYWMGLQEKYPDKVVWLKGNHEQALLQRFAEKPSAESLVKLKYGLKKYQRDLNEVITHIEALPLKFETDTVYITHAGIAKTTQKPFDLESSRSVLNNRDALKCLPKMQVVGHNVVEGNKPIFSTKENAWHIDTGAWVKKYLSALLINEQNQVTVIRQTVDKLDQPEA